MKAGLRMLFVVVTVAAVPLTTLARSKDNFTYDGAVNFASQAVDSRNGCVSVDGTLKSGDFFSELKRKDLDAGSQYSRNGQEVTEYPETLIASIQILGSRCSGSTRASASSIFTRDSYAVTFQVDWKSGLDMRPAALSPVVAHCTGATALINTSYGVLTVPALNCEVTVQSKGVSLADHLVVSLYGADGNRITRISAAP